MEKNYIEELNEYIAESILEKDDEYILSHIGKEGFLSLKDLKLAMDFVKQAVERERNKFPKKDNSKD